MKKVHLLVVFVAAFSLLFAVNTAKASMTLGSKVCCESYGLGAQMVKVDKTYAWAVSNDCVTPVGLMGSGKEVVDNSHCQNNVTSITLTGADSATNKIIWYVVGTSSQGFKVVWSKNENPVYPNRDGDTYHYFSDPATLSDNLNAFNGSGTYYVRVCEYLSNGTCGVYSNQITLQLASSTDQIQPASFEVYLHAGTAGGGAIEWTTSGVSSQGFKVVWSKNDKPVYPSRSGDTYHYFSDPNINSDTITAFKGAGRYYVRVCEYSNGVCLKYSNQIFVYLTDQVTCTTDYNPVCGSDGKTYSNSCHASAAGVTVKSSGECAATAPAVSSIQLFLSTDSSVKWLVTGKSVLGFKVVWSKNENPVYPNRDGDQYHYYSDSNTANDTLEAFNGSGTYYVRVCQYLGDKCGVYSNQISLTLGGIQENKTCTSQSVKVCGADGKTYANSCEANAAGIIIKSNGECKKVDDKKNLQLSEIHNNASDLYSNKINDLLGQINALRDLVKEQQTQINYLMNLQKGLNQTLSASSSNAITNFITYGVDANTQQLGQGQRAAVMYSFREAYGKLPATQTELEDAIKIANGRWPSATSSAAEASAKSLFKKIYLRDADMNNAHDSAAIKIMAYGLQQQAKNRNLKSEAAALKTFKAIFNRLPSNTLGWNTLAAITYSGASR